MNLNYPRMLAALTSGLRAEDRDLYERLVKAGTLEETLKPIIVRNLEAMWDVQSDYRFAVTTMGNPLYLGEEYEKLMQSLNMNILETERAALEQAMDEVRDLEEG